MQRTAIPTRRERLVNDLCAAAVDLQALAQRLANGADLPPKLRGHAEQLAQAGRVAALAAVSANGGHNPQALILFYGEYLTASERTRERLCALDEAGFIPKGSKPDHPQSSVSLAKRRTAALRTGEPVPSS